MKFLISAGPTREMLDEVRFFSNLSSGKTGFAIAQAAQERGHEVILVSGPVQLSPPTKIDYRPVISALEMFNTMVQEFPSCDAVIMSAAVADYRPAQRVKGKLKKSSGPLTLELVRNPDILKKLGEPKQSQVLIGFALEVANAEANAQQKLEKKNLDLIVLNGPGNFASSESEFRALTATGFSEVMGMTKESLGHFLGEKAEELHRSRPTGA